MAENADQGKTQSIDLMNKAIELERQHGSITNKNLAEKLAGMRKAREEALRMFKEGKDGERANMAGLEETLKLYDHQIASMARIQQLVGKDTTALQSFNKALGFTDKLMNKLGFDLSAGPVAGALVWALRMMDAQRVTRGFVTSTMRNFGTLSRSMKSMGKEAADNWLNEFTLPSKENMLLTSQFITDAQRQDFVKALYNTGVQVRGVSGQAMQDIQERLLMLSNAFGMTTEQIVGKLNTFNDIFRFSTGAAAKEIELLTSLALKLGVAPARFLNMVEQLTTQFKLQRIQIHEITDVYQAYYKNLNLGVAVTEDLTNRTVSALGELKEGRIAAYLAITKQLSGQALGSELVSFYGKSSTDQTSTRLALVQQTLNILSKQFASGLQNEYAQVRLVMETFGVQDFETGTRLWQVVDKMYRQGIDQATAVEEAKKILEETTGAEDQLMNILMNVMSAVMKYLYVGMRVLGGKAVGEAVLRAQRPLTDLLDKQTDADKAFMSSLEYGDLETNTSLEAIQTIAAKSYEKLSQSVSLQAMQIQATQAQSLVAAAAAATPAGAAAAAGVLAKNFVMQDMANKAEMIVKLVPTGGLENLVELEKQVNNTSIATNMVVG